jgi:heme/copper-type cytochrome/quinol oxidase subunit 2
VGADAGISGVNHIPNTPTMDKFNNFVNGNLSSLSSSLRGVGLFCDTYYKSSNLNSVSQLRSNPSSSTKLMNVKNAVSLTTKSKAHVKSNIISFSTKFRASKSLCDIVLPRLYDDLDTNFLGVRSLPEVSSTRDSSRGDTSINLVGGLVSRLRITSGVCLPSDVAIHLVCGSKDVIHSWAVPGLSIKIDCIPGYNCHRRLLIR